MRRLWANIIIAATCLIGVFAAFPSVANNISTNGDYEVRRVFTFEISEKETNADYAQAKTIEENTAKEMAKIMEERLINSGITSYEITTSGSDIITIAYAANSRTQYNYITQYLTFSGSFALINEDENGEAIPGKDFLAGDVYMKTPSANEYPTVIIPVNTDSEQYRQLIEWAKNSPKTSTSDSDSEEETSTCPIYIIYNYEEGDTYKSLTESNKNKILLQFDATSDATLYYEPESENKAFSQICGYSDSNGNGYADASEVRAAYDQADYLVNLFHASVLDYKVTAIRGVDTSIYTEAAIGAVSYQSRLTFNSTMIALLSAVIIVSLILILFFKLNALPIIVNTVVNTFLTFLFITLIGMEFNSLAIIGYVAIALISLVSGVIHAVKFSEECYRGRTLKKANSEASRKSTLPVVDIHIVSAIIALLLFLLGGEVIHTFASILLLGSMISIIVSLLGVKGMMWLNTNTTKLAGRYDVFGVNSEKVPDYMSEEKQVFYGEYADRDLTEKKKPISIVALVLSALSLIGIITYGALNSGNITRTPNYKDSASEIYVVNTVVDLDGSPEAVFSQDDLESYLGNMKLYYTQGEEVNFTEEDTHKTFLDYVGEIQTFTYSESKTVESETTTYFKTYYQVKLTKVIDGNTTYVKIKDNLVDPGTSQTVNEAFESYFTDVNIVKNSSICLKAIQVQGNVPNISWGRVALASVISLVVITLYLMLRYRLSRGLATILYPLASSLLGLGIFALLSAIGGFYPANILVVAPIASLVSYIFMILIANKEREMVIEDKSKDVTPEHRKELSIKALGIAMNGLVPVLFVTAILLVVFGALGYAINSYMFVGSLIATFISYLLVKVTYMPLSNVFYKWFSKVHVERKPKANKKKNAKANTNKGAEPEEAIFIGINDY